MKSLTFALGCSAPCAASCIRMVRPNWRAPISMIETGRNQSDQTDSAIAAAMITQAWTTSSGPIQPLRADRRSQSSRVKRSSGRMRAAAGMGAV